MIKKIKNVKDRLENKLNEVLLINKGLEQQVKTQEQLLDRITDKLNKLNYVPVIYISDKTIIAKMFNGQLIYLSLEDISVAPHIAMEGIWESNITKAWINNIKHDATIIDIGANFGYFGLVASSLLDKKSSRVIYFEPNPELADFINKSVAINWLKENSVVENMAVSDKPGKAKLTILKDFIGSSSLHNVDHLKGYLANTMDVEASKEISVDAVTIDTYCEKNGIQEVDLIKMDIEGFEDAAYRGMRKVVKRSKDLVFFIEFTKKSYKKPKEFFEIMKNDFKYSWVIDSDGNTINITDKSYEEFFTDIDDWIMLVFSKNNLVKRMS